MSVLITAVRPLILGGVNVAIGGTATVSDALAADLIWRGDATGTLPTPPPALNTDVAINVAQIVDSGAQGRSIVQAGTFDQLLTAMGASLGAADSGGAGFKAIRVPNAVT